MTLALVALTPDGIVLTADSRQTYINRAQASRIGTDNAKKLFKLSDKVGIVVAGNAFALDSKNQLKNISWFVEEFKKEWLKNSRITSIKTIAKKFKKYLEGNNIVGVSFIVAGNEPNGSGKAYLVLNGIEIDDTLSRNTQDGGFLRIGQDDVVTRIMNGRSSVLMNVEFVKNAIDSGIDVNDQLAPMHYVVNWGTITLQDAVDFCVLMTRITENMQRFSDGTFMNPGGVPGVGGAIDVATITDAGFLWLQKKELSVVEI